MEESMEVPWKRGKRMKAKLTFYFTYGGAGSMEVQEEIPENRCKQGPLHYHLFHKHGVGHALSKELTHQGKKPK